MNKPIEKAKEAIPSAEVDEITYIPSEGAPSRTEWNGIKFIAGVPVKVSRKHTVLVPLPVETTAADGTIQTRHLEKRLPMVELAKNNPDFSVNGEPPAARKDGVVRLPSNPDEYRGYAINWIARSTAAGAMRQRWEAEAPLRDKCGCDDNDIAYLMPFYEARIEQTSEAA
jgi:hypothetical protein